MIALLLLLSAQVPVSEHAERRERLMASFGDGIVLLHARFPVAA